MPTGFSKTIATKKAASAGFSVGTAAGSAGLLAPILAAFLRRQWPNAPWDAGQDVVVVAAALASLGAAFAAVTKWVSNWRKHS